MKSLNYDKTKTLATNVLELFKYCNWLYAEMLQGRVLRNTDKGLENEQGILQVQADVVEAVVDEYNALCE